MLGIQLSGLVARQELSRLSALPASAFSALWFFFDPTRYLVLLPLCLALGPFVEHAFRGLHLSGLQAKPLISVIQTGLPAQ